MLRRCNGSLHVCQMRFDDWCIDVMASVKFEYDGGIMWVGHSLVFQRKQEDGVSLILLYRPDIISIRSRLHRGSPFPAPPPAAGASVTGSLTPGPLAPGCLLSANKTGSSLLPAAPPAPTPEPPAVARGPSRGPRRSSSSRPRSRQAGSFLDCVAR